MSDYRLGLDIEHGEDRSYLIDKHGRRFEIQSFDMTQSRNQRFLPPSRKWGLYLGLIEVEEPVPAPQLPPKRRLSDLGLRRPK